jgi:hypothetical protein
MTFEELLKFVESHMRMSHVYQPVMLRELARNGGTCSEERIARALLSEDRSQVEYYEAVTRNMVGQVLRKRGIVTRDRGTKHYSLSLDKPLTKGQAQAIVDASEIRLRTFIDARGDQPWHHRSRSAGDLSGSTRYAVLKAARYRCELCGVRADDRALEVDHIMPRAKGGGDHIENLQALCYKCNASKRDRDSTDFRGIADSWGMTRSCG